MFIISAQTHFWASHQLSLPDGSEEPVHSHDWLVVAEVAGEQLNDMGLVMDFRRLKAIMDGILANLEGTQLNALEYFRRRNPSAENVARYIYEQLDPRLPKGVGLRSVCVGEEPGYLARFERSCHDADA